MTPSSPKGLDWGRIFFLLAERFGYTIDQICDMTIDAALILLSEGKDPSRRTMTIKTAQQVPEALRRLNE